MKKIIIFTNVAVPFRIDFYNLLGKQVDLTVVFEAEFSDTVKYNWNLEAIKNFKVVFLKNGEINERKLNLGAFKQVLNDDYDFIIVSGYASITDKALILYLKLKKIPFYMQIDGGLIKYDNIFKKTFKKCLITNAKGYFSPSKAADEYLLYYGAKKERIYRYPFTSLMEKDILKKNITKDEKLYIKNKLNIKSKRIILSVGQFIPRKGMDILIRASQNLPLNVNIYIVGGNAPLEYKKLVDNLKLNNIKFIGYKSKEQLKEYFLAADLFVLATREDIWGLVINEAMAYGLPVITTDKCLAGIELVSNDENGYIIPTDDVATLNKSMNYIIQNDEVIEKMEKESLIKIKNYTIEMMVKKYLEILN